VPLIYKIMTKILIVDDSILIIKHLSLLFEEIRPKKDFSIITAKDGLEAIEKYKTEKPDIIFMDVVMPNLDGISTLKKLKEINSEVKVIIASSVTLEQTISEAMREGALGYILKPFKKEDFKKVFEEHLNWE
jgi:two-component system, chemotaxis family, chemotaxis protein CheY